MRLRLSFVVALLFLALLSCLFALRPRSVSAHGCAPPIPPPVPGPLVPAPATPGVVHINEVLAAPGSTWNCSEQGTHSLSTDSWVELYNPGNRPLDLYSVHARFVSGPNTYVFNFPLDAAIGPHGFLVLFPNANSGLETRCKDYSLVWTNPVNQAILSQKMVCSRSSNRQSLGSADGGSPLTRWKARRPSL